MYFFHYPVSHFIGTDKGGSLSMNIPGSEPIFQNFLDGSLDEGRFL